MNVYSMTGFARVQGIEGDCAWGWEIKSVNGKGLEARTRLPGGFESLEQPVRDRIAKQFRRGNFSVNLAISRDAAAGGYRINQGLLDQLIALAPELQKKLPDAGPVSVDGLLAVRGVVEAIDESAFADRVEDLTPVLLKALDQALAQLSEMRAAEGARLAEVLEDRLATIERLGAAARALSSLHPDAIRDRLKRQVDDLLNAGTPLSEERLAQEAALLATKADVREELDRLVAHIAAARDLMAEDGPVGRKLDFLCQELNREANTLCSKSPDTELTKIGLDLKAVIEQFREQVQNIE